MKGRRDEKSLQDCLLVKCACVSICLHARGDDTLKEVSLPELSSVVPSYVDKSSVVSFLECLKPFP